MHVLQMLEGKLRQHEQQGGEDAGEAVEGRDGGHHHEPAIHREPLKTPHVCEVGVVVEPDGQSSACHGEDDLWIQHTGLLVSHGDMWQGC